MKRLLCKVGRHDWNKALHAEAWGQMHIQVTMDKVCRRCRKHSFYNEVIDIRDIA